MTLNRSLLIVALLLAGCDRRPTTVIDTPPALTPTVSVVRPERGTLRRTVRQPGNIQAYEQTPIFAKISGYVQKWNFDIGDHAKKDQVLAELDIPDLVADLKLKEEMIKQDRESLAVAEARVATAGSLIEEAKAALQRADADQERWRLENDRIANLSGVIDRRTKDETWFALQSAIATKNLMTAKIQSANATLKESVALKRKAQADISAAEAERDRVAALVSYTRLPAPFDGVVTRRNINTGDLAQAPTGVKGEPLYIVERRDIMRVFLDVREADATSVKKGAEVHIQVPIFEGPDFVGTVARTSYALDRTARTLVVQVDLPNPKDQLRPGMYAIGTITVEQSGVLTLPASAVITQGDVIQGYESFCLIVADGKIERTQIAVGARGTDRVEVLKKRAKSARPGAEGAWVDFSGEEAVVEGNVAALSAGQAVNVSAAKK